MNIANGPNVIKFYLYRVDPTVNGEMAQQVTPCAQIIMPVDGFLTTFAFMEHAIADLIKKGELPKDLLEARRASISETEDDADTAS